MYLDYCASTPVDPRVLEEMLPYFHQQAANAGSGSHASGRATADVVEQSRADIAALISAEAKDIIFTASATESINIALQGLAQYRATDGKHIICSAVEHSAVLAVYAALAAQGWQITQLSVDEYGQVALDDFIAAIRPDTVLLSLIHANNETGTVQDIAAFGAVCRQHNITYHVDAAQSYGKIPLDVDVASIDLLSCSAHKMYGPKGIAALYIRRRKPRTRLTPIFFGGEQERGYRPGSLNVSGIVGFAAAARIAALEMGDEQQQHQQMRTNFVGLCTQLIPDIHTNVALAGCLPATISMMCTGIDAQELLCSLPEMDMALGSACASTIAKPSHVLRAMGRSIAESTATFRVSFGRFTTVDELTHAAQSIAAAVAQQRHTHKQRTETQSSC